MQQLHGFENCLTDLVQDLPEIHRLKDDLLRFHLEWIECWLKMDYQGLQFADDWGSQAGLLIAPDLWRRFFKPVYAAMFSRVKSTGLDVWFHSDGNIIEILPDLIELGVDVLNCQASVIDRKKRMFHFTTYAPCTRHSWNSAGETKGRLSVSRGLA